ncbi:hypothetical protein WA158_004822 [Blastocystis sp. Blastoise]
MSTRDYKENRVCNNLLKYGHCEDPSCTSIHPSMPVTLEYIKSHPVEYIDSMTTFQNNLKFVLRDCPRKLCADSPECLDILDLKSVIDKYFNSGNDTLFQSAINFCSLNNTLAYYVVDYLIKNSLYDDAYKLINKYSLSIEEYPEIKKFVVRNRLMALISGLKRGFQPDILYEEVKRDKNTGYTIYNEVLRMYGPNFEVTKTIGKMLNQSEKFGVTSSKQQYAIDLFEETNKPVVNPYVLPSSVPIEIITTPQQLEKNIEEMVSFPFLGFDSEWNPNDASSTPQLIQIASISKVWLLKMNQLLIHDHSTLNDIYKKLNDKPIVHIWLGSSTDMHNMKKSLPDIPSFFDIDQCVDLDDYLDAKYSKPFAGIGLTSLAYIFSGHYLDKRQCMSCWAKNPLSPQQILYGAIDAYIEAYIYDLVQKYDSYDTLPVDIQKRFVEIVDSRRQTPKNDRKKDRNNNRRSNPQKQKESAAEVWNETPSEPSNEQTSTSPKDIKHQIHKSWSSHNNRNQNKITVKTHNRNVNVFPQ